jgi:hypothetical protein
MRRQFLAAVTGAALLLLAPSAVSATNLQAYRYPQMSGRPLSDLEVRPRATAPPREIVAYEGPTRLGLLSSRRRNAAFILFCRATKP